MDKCFDGWMGLVVLFALLALGVPIGIGMGIVGFTDLLFWPVYRER
jgi:hypothetical protein